MSNDVQLSVERIGGLGGFGLPGSHLKSIGEISTDALSQDELRKLEAYFTASLSPKSSSKTADGFKYRITKKVGTEIKIIELPEELTPISIRNCVKDTLD